MPLAVYNPTTNTVRTVIRADHGGYQPPAGWALVALDELPNGWSMEPPDFETAKQDKLAALADWWQSQEAAGVQPSGYNFRLGIKAEDVALLTGAFMLAQTAVTIGEKTTSDTFPIVDITGAAHFLTLPQLTGMLLSYGEARAALSATYAERLAAVAEASNVTDLASIETA